MDVKDVGMGKDFSKTCINMKKQICLLLKTWKVQKGTVWIPHQYLIMGER